MLHSRGLLRISFLLCTVTLDAIQMQVTEDVEYQCFSASSYKKLTLVTVVAGLPETYVSALRKNRMLEADAYNYEYCEFRSRQDPNRHPNWEKVKALQHLFAQGWQRLVWMDADAYFSKKKPFEFLTHNGEFVFSKLGKVDIIFTDDIGLKGGECDINTGVMAMINSNWTQKLWRETWDLGKPAEQENGNHDQPALCKWKADHMSEFGAHTMIIPHHLMNSVTELSGSEFISHVAGGGGHIKYGILEPNVGHANAEMGGARTLSDMASDILPYLEDANRAMETS